MQSKINWKAVTILAVGLVFLLGSVSLIRTVWREPDLSIAICQAGDLGERYLPRPVGMPVADAYLGETVVDYYAVTLEDLSLTYTALNCEIIEYEAEAAAHRAFQRGCDPSSTLATPRVGDEACQFTTSAPRTLAFRRDRFLIRMSGDVTSIPAQAVDDRLR